VKSDAGLMLQELRVNIDGALKSFVKVQADELSKIGSELEPAANALAHFTLDGGKRLRPIFAAVGYLGTGREITKEIIAATSSLELIHVCALIHDDLMDGSDTRRGAPAIHREFEAIHRSEGGSGNPERFGSAAAILLGDLALVWSAKMLHESGILDSDLLNCLPIYDELRVELMAGQFLDIYEQTLRSSSLERSRKIARYKSGKYTIERPLHFGAALAGVNDLDSRYTAYGIPLGEAFQLRDDILGVFGESSTTGKPAGDDLLEGKRTALIAKTYELCDASQALVVSSVLGNRSASIESINKVKDIIEETGALKEIEDLISRLTNEALVAIEKLPNNELLSQLAALTTKRSS
jgi:geranylgeranyl diphosphate synthase, type I